MKSEEPYIPSKEPYILSKEPYIPSKETYISRTQQVAKNSFAVHYLHPQPLPPSGLVALG